jgi:hypothetical protein
MIDMRSIHTQRPKRRDYLITECGNGNENPPNINDSRTNKQMTANMMLITCLIGGGAGIIEIIHHTTTKIKTKIRRLANKLIIVISFMIVLGRMLTAFALTIMIIVTIYPRTSLRSGFNPFSFSSSYSCLPYSWLSPPPVSVASLRAFLFVYYAL